MQSKTVAAATTLGALSIQRGQFMALFMKSCSFVGLINVPIFPSESRPQVRAWRMGCRSFAWDATAKPGTIAQPASALLFHVAMMAAPNNLAATDRQGEYSRQQLSSVRVDFVFSCGKWLG